MKIRLSEDLNCAHCVDVVNAAESGAETNMLSIKLSRCSLMCSRIIFAIIFSAGRTQIPLHLSHSRRLPSFGILTVIPFHHSLGEVPKSQDFHTSGGSRSTVTIGTVIITLLSRWTRVTCFMSLFSLFHQRSKRQMKRNCLISSYGINATCLCVTLE